MQVFGNQHAMRIWMDPFKLNNFQLMPGDIQNALLAQNIQIAAGQLGGLPAPPGQQLNATVTAQSRLQTPEQFRAIVLKTQHRRQPGAAGRRGAGRARQRQLRHPGPHERHPSAGVAIQLAPGANALTTADAVKAKAEDLSKNLPPGVELSFPSTTPCSSASPSRKWLRP